MTDDIVQDGFDERFATYHDISGGEFASFTPEFKQMLDDIDLSSDQLLGIPDDRLRVVFLSQPEEVLIKDRLAKFSVAVMNSQHQLAPCSLTLVSSIVHEDGSPLGPEHSGASLTGQTQMVVNGGVAQFAVKPAVLSGRRPQSLFRIQVKVADVSTTVEPGLSRPVKVISRRPKATDSATPDESPAHTATVSPVAYHGQDTFHRMLASPAPPPAAHTSTVSPMQDSVVEQLVTLRGLLEQEKAARVELEQKLKREAQARADLEQKLEKLLQDR